MFRFAPRAADVEKSRGCDDCDKDVMDMLVVTGEGRWGCTAEVVERRERREKEVERVEKVEDCALFLSKSDRLLRSIGALDGIESSTHLNMRPQIRHMLGV